MMIEKIPYATIAFVILTFVAAVLIPLFYDKIVKRRGKKRIRQLSKYNRQIIVGVFAYFLGLLAIANTPVLIPFVNKVSKGNQYYPLITVVVVATLMVMYIIIVYTIITITNKVIVKRLRTPRA